ncbi:MAG: hypothetical protein COT73_08585 [Bdellovibrio sp. CG10_big_fil_rev_8_21_14_0_10_47_8]|nr:MAG: hypothetical protein COT73_08585 [Bdellovibrio sp. CG10_big_fil_rev_8_21_14_0_10_47_8]
MAMNWLPLTEYSSKYKVSISTLRRRIKAEDIKFQFRDGRYLIFDQPDIEQQHRPSQTMSPSPKKPATPFSGMAVTEMTLQKPKDEPILTAANRLLTELKRAYAQILQEKEEQILNLKEEVSDLKTLVRVLEAENLKLSQRK